jgi:hypothetical protein
MPGIPIPPFMRPRGAWTREGGLRKRWPAPNLADGALCRQDLGLTLLHHVADRRTLEALVLNWYQTRYSTAKQRQAVTRTQSAALLININHHRTISCALSVADPARLLF